MPSYGPFQVSGVAPVFLGRVYPNEPTMQIINRSAFRIFVNSNSSFRSGSGTPVEPLTAIQWNVRGDLWAVIDSTEPAGSVASVLLSSDSSLWTPSPVDVAAQIFQTGIVTQDDPQTLAFNFGSVVPANATQVPFDQAVTLSSGDDLSKYQSIFGSIKWQNVSGVFNYLRVMIQYFDTSGAFQVGQDTFVINPSFVGGLTDQTYFRLPLRGQRVRMQVTNLSANPGTVSYAFYTSYRSVERPYYEEVFGDTAPVGYGSDGILAYQNVAGMLATTSFPIAIHQGRVMVTFRNGAGSGAATTLQVSNSATDPSSISGFLFSSSAVAIGAQLPAFELILPARPCKFQVNGAVAPGISFNCAIIAQDR